MYTATNLIIHTNLCVFCMWDMVCFIFGDGDGGGGLEGGGRGEEDRRTYPI